MASKKEAKKIRKFVCEELRGEPDLSKLTLGILKRRYLAHVQREKLTPEARNIMKRVIEEQLMKMQDNDENESEGKTNTKPPNKRKRKKESAGRGEDEEDESMAKKSRRQSNSSSESVEKDDCKTGSEGEEQINSVSEDEEQAVKKKRRKTNANIKRQISSEDSTDEEINRSKDVEEGPKEMVIRRTNATRNGEKRSSNSQAAQKSVEKDNCKTGSESEEEEKTNFVSKEEDQGVKIKRQKTNAKIKQQISSEDSTDEEINRSKDGKSDIEEGPKEMVTRKTNAAQNGEKRSSNSSPGKTPQSDGEKETDLDSESEKGDNDNDPSDHSGKEEKLSVETKNNDVDSDSSSLPSLEDEPQSGKGKTQDDKKKRPLKKEQQEKTQKDDNKAVVRLKRYISLCGVRLNYKKLLDGCRSVRSKVDVLKKELEGLGVDGQPSIVKCKKVRMKREESKELAELDVNNIIATKGRPRRRVSSAWQENLSPPSSTYLRSLNSGSDSDEENNTHRARRRATDWANLQGIISDDADSN